MNNEDLRSEIKQVPVSTGEKVSVKIKHSDKADACSILFIHGLGDSKNAWDYAFESDYLRDYDLIALDLLGYGDTEVKNSTIFSFSSQVKMLLEIFEYIEIKKAIIIAHSMGGVIASLLVAQLQTGFDPSIINEPQKVLDWLDSKSKHKTSDKKLRLFIDVEGNLTAKDATISGRAVKADAKSNFPKWFDKFKATTQSGPWAEANPSLGHYGRSLEKCLPSAFLQGSIDLNSWKQNSNSEKPLAGELYTRLDVEKFYFFGTQSIPETSREFIKEEQIRSMEFSESGHWLMNDASDDFYSKLKSIL